MIFRNSVKIGVMAVLLAVMCVPAQAGNIDAANKYAWATNAGWVNFNPTNGGGTVCPDHLEGDVWAENIGWIRLGSSTNNCGSALTYANTNDADYGVNNTTAGVLSGYAWSTNAGWIKFKPTNGGVTIDSSGNFSGYAWGENIGWINFANTTPAYKVVTTWHSTATSYALTVNNAGTGIGITTGAGNYTAGTTVTLAATANTGSVFVGWSGSGCPSSTNATETLSMPANALTCTATFNLSAATYAFTTATAGTGTGTVGGTSAGSYAAGTAITLTATPTGGSAFAGWSAGCSLSFNMPANALTCTATFTAAVVPVTAGVTLTGIGSITGSTALATGNATGAGIGERGFYWWIPPTDATHFGGSESGLLPEGNGAGSFSLKLTDLRPGHTYRVKAYVKVGGQIITSDEQIFTTATTGATGKIAPTVLTDTKNFTVSGSSITVNGEITDIGSSAVNVYGFVYAPHTAPFTGHEMPKTGDMAYAMWDKAPVYQGMKFTGTIKNIPPGKWYLRAYAHNTNPDSSADQPESLGYGQDISFTIACTPETCIPGDVNGDGKVGLDDAMLVLRILAGIPVGNINLNADVNGDGRIGLEELGYILQKVSELRPSGT